MYTRFVLKVSPKGLWCVTSVTVYLYASVVVSHTVENVICTKIIELHAYVLEISSVVRGGKHAASSQGWRGPWKEVSMHHNWREPEYTKPWHIYVWFHIQNCVAWHVLGWVYLECHSYWPFDPTYIACKEMYKLKLTTIPRWVFLMVEHKLLQYSRQWYCVSK